MSNSTLRARILKTLGASDAEVEELLVYNDPRFTVPDAIALPLPPEAHIATWAAYAVEAQQRGAFAVLRDRLVQFAFPIQAGMSQTEAYRAVTRKGAAVGEIAAATGLVLQHPAQLQLFLHDTIVGPIPVVQTPDRQDFVSLVQALAKRNEPEPIPASMGACLVTGLNNWDRIRQYRQQWESQQPGGTTEADWAAEFQRLIPQKHRYQDRLILLSEGAYSNVSATAIGLSESEWLRLSGIIRLEHECTHYATDRLFGSMQNRLMDELIADYRGIVAATGYYRADWFLHFMGLEAFPQYREGGRLQNYRDRLSEGSFKILQALVVAAARNLETWQRSSQPTTPVAELRLLCGLTLEALAAGNF